MNENASAAVLDLSNVLAEIEELVELWTCVRLAAAGALDVVPEHVGSSGSPWRLRAAKPPQSKEDTG